MLVLLGECLILLLIQIKPTDRHPFPMTLVGFGVALYFFGKTLTLLLILGFKVNKSNRKSTFLLDFFFAREDIGKFNFKWVSEVLSLTWTIDIPENSLL